MIKIESVCSIPAGDKTGAVTVARLRGSPGFHLAQGRNRIALSREQFDQVVEAADALDNEPTLGKLYSSGGDA